MKIDMRTDAGALERRAVIRLDRMAAIADIVYADDESGEWGTWRRGADGQIEQKDGKPIILDHAGGPGSIRIVRQ